MSAHLGRRAVIIGAGIGGLSAAGALAGYFEQVDVLERDPLPPGADPRPGTPQDRHPHGLLAGGLRALGEIFPGFDADLAKAGAVPIRVAQDFQYESAHVGTLPRRDLGLSILCASRPLIELVLRRRVEAIANITLRPGCRVTEIVPATNRAGRPGVRFNGVPERPTTLHADLVVDASGRGAPTLALLDCLGLRRPQVTEIGVDLKYATAVVHVPPNSSPERKVVLTQPDPPTVARHSVLIPIEGDRWMVLIADHGGHTRITNWYDFLDAARRLTTQSVYHMLRHVEPPLNIRHYGFPASRWQHFEQLPSLPHGVLPVADSLCRFNPIYGQGMSVAGKEARALQLVSERVSSGLDPIAALQAEFMAEAAAILPTPWNMSTSADLAFPTTRGERPDNFIEGRQFEAALFRAAVADPVVHRAMTEVAQLLRPFSHLQESEIRQRIEAASVKSAA